MTHRTILYTEQYILIAECTSSASATRESFTSTFIMSPSSQHRMYSGDSSLRSQIPQQSVHSGCGLRHRQTIR